MKRFYLLVLILTTYFNSQAFAGQPVESYTDTIKVQPKEKFWKFAAVTNMNFNQISFSNWAAGGENAFSGTAGFFPSLIYKKKNLTFESTGAFSYGMIDRADENGGPDRN